LNGKLKDEGKEFITLEESTACDSSAIDSIIDECIDL